MGTAARDWNWPDDDRGNAVRLLVHDLEEFGQAMTTCAKQNFWSVEKALERMFIERVEVLIGAPVDVGVAKRYLKSGVVSPESGTPLKPNKRARPEDAVEAFARRSELTEAEKAAFRAMWLETKGVSSDWFVHPTAMGPVFSLQGQSDTALVAGAWSFVVQLLSTGCYWTVMAAHTLNVPVGSESLKSIRRAGECLVGLNATSGAQLLELHRALTANVVWK